MDISKTINNELQNTKLPEGMSVASGSFTKEDMKDGYVLDVDDQAPEIPDLEKLTKTCLEIIRFISTDEMVKLKHENEDLYKETVDDKFRDFADTYYSFFSMIISDNFDIADLRFMIQTMKSIKENNIDMKAGHEKFVDGMAEKYVYPEHGGKEGFLNFVDKAKKKTEKKDKRKARKAAKK